MPIKIEMLRCFCMVAETGNLAEAANRLGRTQSAVSMTLKRLEDHLGKRLFEADRKNRLSALGVETFDLAQKQLRQFDLTVQAIETSAGAPRGLIRVVSVPSVAALLMPHALDVMARRHPGLRIELRDTDTQQVVDALAQGRADIGIASGAYKLNGIKAQLLFEDRFGLVCARDHPLARRAQQPTVQDLCAGKFIRNALCDMIADRGFHDATANADISVHNTLSLIAMVRQGGWVTVLPRTVARFMPDVLAFRPIRGLDETRQVYLYLREHCQFPHLAKDFSDILAARASDGSGQGPAFPGAG